MSEAIHRDGSEVGKGPSIRENRTPLQPHLHLKAEECENLKTPFICDYCGGRREVTPYRCPGLDHGWCHP